MNNSVFTRFNFVDAIIILTGAKLILHPIYSKISMKLQNSLTIKQYGFNHLFKLKRKPKPEPIRVDLPDDVIVSILSKVDIDTLRRCTQVLSLDAILPQIVSFSTPLDASLFIPDKSGSWYGKLFNQVILNCIPLIEFIMERRSVISSTVIDLTVYVFWWVNMRKLKPEAINFLQRLRGLESLEIELPSMPCYSCRVQPHLWYRWDAKIKVDELVSNYCLYVFGDKVNNSDGDDLKQLSLMLRGIKMAAYNNMFHWSIIELLSEGDVWKTGIRVRTKDVEGNGGLMIGSQSITDGDEPRFRILHLPSTLKFNCYIKDEEEEDSLQVQDVVLMFTVFANASDDRDDNDILMACLGDMDDEEGEEANRRRELRQIVSEIISDENCKVIFDSH